jgi:tripartite-type tricarboxylate transporter receptor subunit TctC
MKLSRIAFDLLSVLAVTLLAAGAATAQRRPDGFPARTVRIIVPFPAGGPTDVIARLIGMKLTETWGQSVLIENRPGANTVIGAQIVAKAAPDGYTLLMAIDSTLAMNQFLYRTPPYDPINDFAPVTLVARTSQFLSVNAASDIKSVGELIAKAKAEPGRLTYGAGTIVTKLAGFLFSKTAGITTTMVPYNGSADVAQALLTRSVDFTFDGPTTTIPNVQAGKFRVLAKFDERPFPAAPDAPVITRDLPGVGEIIVWVGLVAPHGTPSAIVGAIQREVATALSDRAIATTAEAAGLYPAPGTPEAFAAFIRREADRWSKVLPETGMRFD